MTGLHAGSALELRDALPLAIGFASARATTVGVRALPLKGLVANHHRIRPERMSADVDMLVEPAGFEQYLDQLAAAGWEQRPGSNLASRLVMHSVSLLHPAWPCDIDVHPSYPGLLAEPGDVFEVMWGRGQSTPFAHFNVVIPDRDSAILVQALHSLRTWRESPRHQAEYEYLVRVVIPQLDRVQRVDVLELAEQVGAVDTARPLLRALDLRLPAPLPSGADPRLDTWRKRVASGADRTAQVLLALQRERGVGRLRLASAVLWPTRFDLELDGTVPTGSTTMRVLVARFARLLRGLRLLPRTLRAISKSPDAAD